MNDHSADRGSGRATGIQARYYTETALAYDAMHVHENDGHDAALRFISTYVDDLQLRSVLDVGCGTGRALRYFRHRHPGMPARGVEPTRALIRQAVEAHGIEATDIVYARGESLPFAAASFDAVCELGILHHVPNPNAVVREMLRVAQRAVFVSDANRFGQGSWLGRIAKLALYRAKLWPVVNLIKTRGRGYSITAGDGLAYSYSVFDSYDLLAAWATQIILLPLRPPTAQSWANPLLTAGQVLACAIRS